MKIPYNNINKYIMYDINNQEVGKVVQKETSKEQEKNQKVKKLEKPKVNINI